MDVQVSERTTCVCQFKCGRCFEDVDVTLTAAPSCLLGAGRTGSSAAPRSPSAEP